MASPVPGVDPYLEQGTFWPEFHGRLIVAIADALAPSLLPRYYIAVETRTYRDSADKELLGGFPMRWYCPLQGHLPRLNQRLLALGWPLRCGPSR